MRRRGPQLHAGSESQRSLFGVSRGLGFRVKTSYKGDPHFRKTYKFEMLSVMPTIHVFTSPATIANSQLHSMNPLQPMRPNLPPDNNLVAVMGAPENVSKLEKLNSKTKPLNSSTKESRSPKPTEAH